MSAISSSVALSETEEIDECTSDIQSTLLGFSRTARNYRCKVKVKDVAVSPAS